MKIKSPTTKALKHFGYIQVSYATDLRHLISLAMQTWKQFWNQNLEHKKEFEFTPHGGYEFKDQSMPDFKENFHVSLDFVPAPNIALSNIDIAFIDAAKNLIKHSIPTVKEVAKIMGEGSNFDLETLIVQAKNKWSLRFLHYPPRMTNSDLAESHIDKGITIHFDEDRPGLEVFWQNEWQTAHPMAGYVLAYPGMLGQYYSKCEFAALCHRVTALPETLEKGRNSVVLFLDFGDVIYAKETFGRTQDVFPAGENYHMNFESFKKYFKPLS